MIGGATAVNHPDNCVVTDLGDIVASRRGIKRRYDGYAILTLEEPSAPPQPAVALDGDRIVVAWALPEPKAFVVDRIEIQHRDASPRRRVVVRQRHDGGAQEGPYDAEWTTRFHASMWDPQSQVRFTVSAERRPTHPLHRTSSSSTARRRPRYTSSVSATSTGVGRRRGPRRPSSRPGPPRRLHPGPHFRARSIAILH